MPKVELEQKGQGRLIGGLPALNLTRIIHRLDITGGVCDFCWIDRLMVTFKTGKEGFCVLLCICSCKDTRDSYYWQRIFTEVISNRPVDLFGVMLDV